jgi:hypothetical protein
MPDAPQISVPAGHVAITTYGDIKAPTAQSLLGLALRAKELGLPIAFNFVSGALVDKTRNEAARAMLESPAQWVWFLDADMTFPPELLDRLLTTAFGTHASAALVGGYCCLKGHPYLPTIDTGTGTWEVQHPNQGVLPVIRTGGACLLVKRHVFETLPYPWFGVRPLPRPLDAMAEVDGFARQLYDNHNPFAALPEWKKLTDIASARATEERQRAPALRDDFRMSAAGEDSSFCDAAKAAGFDIVVDTHAICHHLEVRPVGPAEHLAAVREGARTMALAAGVTG